MCRCKGTRAVWSFLMSDFVLPRLQGFVRMSWINILLSEGQGGTYYIKVATLSHHSVEQDPVMLCNFIQSVVHGAYHVDEFVMSASVDLHTTYPVLPLADERCYMMLMRCRGTKRLDDKDALQGISRECLRSSMHGIFVISGIVLYLFLEGLTGGMGILLISTSSLMTLHIRLL